MNNISELKSKGIALLPRLLHNLYFWQGLFALFLLAMAVYFVQHEQIELVSIRQQLQKAKTLYLLLGGLLVCGHILLQGEMYFRSFRALGKTIPRSQTILLFLKRNLISVLLPAGGFSSLAFFSRPIESEQVNKTHVYLASSLYGTCGMLSVIIIAVPALGFALLRGQLQTPAVLGFVFLVLLTTAMVAALVSFLRQGWAYGLLHKRLPQWATMLDEITREPLDRTQLWAALAASVGIECIGVSHLYIAMLALDYPASWPAAFIGYVVMMILLIASPVLRGLGAIEVALTFILNQYGLPVVAAASVTLLFRLFDFWLLLLAGVGSFFIRKDSFLLRVFPVLLLFLTGIVNILSVIAPAVPARLQFVQGIFPHQVISASNGLVMVAGIILLLLAVYLLQGSRRAWVLAVVLVSLSIVGHLTKAIDYEEALFAAFTLISLLYTRSAYILRSHPLYTRLSILVLVYGLLLVLLYGVIGFYFMDKVHFGVDFSLDLSMRQVLRLFFTFDNAGINPLTPFAHWFIFSLYTAGAAYLVFVLYGLLRPYFEQPFNSAEEKALATELTGKYGHSSLNYFKTYPDKLFFFTPDKQAFVSFKVWQHVAIALEDPVAANSETIKAAIRAFDEYCTENGFISAYYRVPEENLPLYTSLGKKSFPIGEEAIVDLPSFSLEGSKMHANRNAVRKLTAEGFIFKVYDPPIKAGLLQKLEQVSTLWLQEKGKAELSFTEGVFDPAILINHPILTIEKADEKVYAFLDVVPSGIPGMAVYDLIRQLPDAPNGILDMLLCQTFLYFKAKGFEKVNMGLAPMSGIDGKNIPQKTIRYAYENLRAFGHFKGLRKYKEKFSPTWEKKYLVYEDDYQLLQVPVALKKVSEASV
ncbi:phosphatidylglycerol lysyltransferase domain-containing protein [Pontibacter burrus]|uniref:Phosphatidylglycerol lysyltransferase n=1 Tax=Pontibacter burrus TaxID=2704466 RepID=A0A6B3LVE9_9BACT|nr:phosphatidylglycerol lysyltransferase domain-containing protein [Pontibacter burrus]NEM97441.1 lysylphosphatidylglycerol synthetase family protein [Pontibacter burrus]